MSQLGQLPSPGETFDRYTVLTELAHGGMAAVYAVAPESGLEKVFAMKVMLPHLVSDSRFVNMFLDEARIAAHVQHPNVVQVFEVGHHERTPYLVMEYLKGQSLSAIRRRVRLPLVAILEILAATADGLHAAHETKDASGAPLNIVHRDISPQNIHVSYSGVVKVVDFGIAAAAGRITHTKTGEVKGKFGYAAPEQLRSGRSVDQRLDLWALGVVAHETLSGRRLFRGESDADTMFNVLNAKVPSLSSLVPNLPADAAEVIHACLERTRELRPHSGHEVALALRAASQELGGIDRAALGKLVSEAFEAEEAIESDRIAQGIGKTPIPTRERESASGRANNVRPGPVETVPTKPARSLKLPLLLAIFMTAAAAVSFYALRSPEDEVEGTVPPPSSPETLVEARPAGPVPVLNQEPRAGEEEAQTPSITMEAEPEGEGPQVRASRMRSMRRGMAEREDAPQMQERTLADQDLLPLEL